MATRPLSLYHERTRRRGVNSLVYWPLRWILKPAILLYFRLRRLGTEHIPEGGVILASNHRSFLDPFAIGCCSRAPDLLRRQTGAVQEPAPRLDPQLPRRLPRQAGSVRRGIRGHLPRAAGARPGGRDLSRGHPHPHRLAGIAEARSRSPGSSERQARGADRSHELRARPPRLAHPAGEGPPALRARAHLPARGRPLTVPCGRGDRADLALRRPPVGVARRPSAAAHRGRGGRGIDGHRGRAGAGARRAPGAARLPHRRPGRSRPRRPR